MKKLFCVAVLSCVLFFYSSKARAQDYENAVGVRLGDENGLTFKKFISNNEALDFILSFVSNNREKSSKLTGLYEIHQQLPDTTPGLGWYYGFGGGLGSVKRKDLDREFLLAIDGVIGLDYKFANDPINISLDYKPTFEIAPNSDLDPLHIGLSVRFTF